MAFHEVETLCGRGRCTSAPALVASAMGRKPRPAIRGCQDHRPHLLLGGPPLRGLAPFRRRLSTWPTSTRPFIVATPARAMKPTPAESGMPSMSTLTDSLTSEQDEATPGSRSTPTPSGSAHVHPRHQMSAPATIAWTLLRSPDRFPEPGRPGSVTMSSGGARASERSIRSGS